MYPPAPAIETEHQRRLGEYIGSEEGSTLIAVGATHGNEPGGVHAIRSVLDYLHEHQVPMRGRFYGVTGNMAALKQGVRYQDTDLNRLYRDEVIYGGEDNDTAEFGELTGVKDELERIRAESRGPITVVDLHSFSGDGQPFVITDNEDDFPVLLNGLPFPVIFGLTDKLVGTLNHYATRNGLRALAIEGGQHNDPETVQNLTLFLWLFLLKRRYIDSDMAPPNLESIWERLFERTSHLPRKLRVVHRHAIGEGDMFKMFPGFQSFTPIREGEPLATDRHGMIHAPVNGAILMPLYQGQGEDGFFVGIPEN